MIVRNTFLMGVLLGLFAVIGTGLVALTEDQTAEQIAENEYQALLRILHAIVPPDLHDNELSSDVITVTDKALLGTPHPVTVYRARLDETPTAAIITTIAPNGYNGAIKLLVAIRYNGTILGVRVLSHRETPGLGDAIDRARSDWIEGFNGRSLSDPFEFGWQVIKDGGDFDQFTGATITPRAVVRAVHNSLKYFSRHKETLFVRNTVQSNNEKKDH